MKERKRDCFLWNTVYSVYLQLSRKFTTTSKHLKSFEVDSSRHAAVKSSQVESDVLKSTAVDLGSF